MFALLTLGAAVTLRLENTYSGLVGSSSNDHENAVPAPSTAKSSTTYHHGIFRFDGFYGTQEMHATAYLSNGFSQLFDWSGPGRFTGPSIWAGCKVGGVSHVFTDLYSTADYKLTAEGLVQTPLEMNLCNYLCVGDTSSSFGADQEMSATAFGTDDGCGATSWSYGAAGGELPYKDMYYSDGGNHKGTDHFDLVWTQFFYRLFPSRTPEPPANHSCDSGEKLLRGGSCEFGAEAAANAGALAAITGSGNGWFGVQNGEKTAEPVVAANGLGDPMILVHEDNCNTLYLVSSCPGELGDGLNGSYLTFDTTELATYVAADAENGVSGVDCASKTEIALVWKTCAMGGVKDLANTGGKNKRLALCEVTNGSGGKHVADTHGTCTNLVKNGAAEAKSMLVHAGNDDNTGMWMFTLWGWLLAVVAILGTLSGLYSGNGLEVNLRLSVPAMCFMWYCLF